jgi:hypothetical protein
MLTYVDTNQALVILMDAISTLTEWVIPLSTVRVWQLIPARFSLSLHNVCPLPSFSPEHASPIKSILQALNTNFNFPTVIGSPLTEIKRFYVQGGTVIPNSQSTIANVTGNSITTAFCDAQKAAFGDNYSFKTHGGMTSMSTAMAGGMTLVMSVWDDHYANMLWLDSTYPTTKTAPGGPRGTCAVTSGVPADVEAQSPGASVTYSNIKFGPINSTFSATSA